MAGEINFGILRPELNDLGGAFHRGQQMSQQSALAAAQIESSQRQNKLADLAMADDQATRQAYQSGGGDLGKTLLGLQQSGQYKPAMELQGKLAAQQKTALETKKGELETHLKNFEVVGQIMSGVTDQTSYDAARQQIAQIVGPEAAAKSPPVYDPAVIERGRNQALSVKEQMANQWKELDAKLKQEDFAYRQQNDTRTDERTRSEGVLNRAATARGQDLTDRRTRDENAKNRTATAGEWHIDSASGMMINKRGETKPIQPAQGGAGAATPGNNDERLAAGYAQRMALADDLMRQIGKEGHQTTGRAVAESVPVVGGYLGRKAGSDKQGQYSQAQADWVRAKLRKESGAAIGDAEMEKEISTYFPMPGDKDPVIAQKAEARKIANDAMKMAAGRAAGAVTGVRPESATAPQGVKPFAADKEARYQAWKRSQGM